jgi:hypothetical protein
MRTLATVALLLLGTSGALAQDFRQAPPVIDRDGNVILAPNATIEFSALTKSQAGPLRGYLLLYVNGEAVLMPVYAPTTLVVPDQAHALSAPVCAPAAPATAR